MKKEKYFQLNQAAVEVLAEKYGTPLLVLSLEQIEKNYNLLRTHMPRVKVFYAIKANPHRRILELMRDLGSNFDYGACFFGRGRQQDDLRQPDENGKRFACLP